MLFKPLQFESVKMDPLVILGRVFSNEPLERTMYMIIIWTSLLMFSPDSWPEYVDTKVGIPHVWHVFIFALSFVAAINAQRLTAVLWKKIKIYKQESSLSERRVHANKVISNLTDAQKMVLCVALSSRDQRVITTQVFPHIKELLELGVLKPNYSEWKSQYLSFPIEPVFWDELMMRWDPVAIDIKPQ